MNNNDKKMPQGNQNQKPGAKPDFDQKKPQSDRGIGQEHGGNANKDKQSSVKPDQGKDTDAKPQSSRIDLDDDELDQESNVDDDDDRITQRSPSRGSEPQRSK